MSKQLILEPGRPSWGKSVLLCAALGLSLSLGGVWRYRQAMPVQPFVCASPQLGCALPRSLARLRFLSPPRVATPFVVSLEGLRASDVALSFAMPGMDMGSPAIHFVAQGGGRWLAPGWLPVCVQGRHDWLATVTIDGVGYRFTFVAGT